MFNARKTEFIYSFLILLNVILPLRGLAEPQVITVVPASNEHHKYCRDLLSLALSYSATTYTLQDLPGGSGGVERDLAQLEQGQLDVIWTASSNYVENRALPIHIPLYRGLLGYRILLIRKGSQNRFEQIKTLEDLKAISLGQGVDWPDTTILKANGFNVVTAKRYEQLFFMLDGGRFDAYPRGVFEPWAELKRWRELNMEVERTLAIVYKMPVYMFVSNDNPALADTIERGLQKAINDGSFNEYFFNSPLIKNSLEQAGMRERKIFHIDNPGLPAATPLDNPILWWSPTE